MDTVYLTSGSVTAPYAFAIRSSASTIQISVASHAFHFSSHRQVSPQYSAFIVLPLVMKFFSWSGETLGTLSASYMSLFVRSSVCSMRASYPNCVSRILAST